jgi:hypothetical protein
MIDLDIKSLFQKQIIRLLVVPYIKLMNFCKKKQQIFILLVNINL